MFNPENRTLPCFVVHPIDSRQYLVHLFPDTGHHFQSILFGIFIEISPHVQWSDSQRKTSWTYVDTFLPSRFPFRPSGQLGTVVQLPFSYLFGQITDRRRGRSPNDIISLDPVDVLQINITRTKGYRRQSSFTFWVYCLWGLRDLTSILVNWQW